MNAEILCVGTELLLGDTINTNASYISKRLSEIGINVYNHSVVGDNRERLSKAVKTALERADALIITGGLGATYDDITKEVVAEILNRKLELNSDVLQNIIEYFEYTGRIMTENNKKQALIPVGATLIPNKHGTAPGIIIEESGKYIVLMPGVPREMKAMTDDVVINYFSKFSKGTFVSKNINFFGISEAHLEYELRDLMKNSLNPTIAPYVKTGEVQLRVTAAAENKDKALELLEPVVDKICSEYSQYIYGVDVPNIETVLVEGLKKSGKKIAVAESCTGGLVAKRLTDIAGASKVFECGVCSYSDKIKNKLLGVKPDTLKKYTAVSEQAAKEMAQGVRKISGADIGISVTGVAGPGDLSKDKPYGLVYIGIDDIRHSDVIKLRLGHHNKNDRDLIRHLSASHALFLALKTI